MPNKVRQENECFYYEMTKMPEKDRQYLWVLFSFITEKRLKTCGHVNIARHIYFTQKACRIHKGNSHNTNEVCKFFMKTKFKEKGGLHVINDYI